MKREYDGFALKRIAVLSMLIDHTAAVLLEAVLQKGGYLAPEGLLRFLDLAMRAAGRLAFPIFCFFIVEGFLHTSRRGRYALRLFLFALLSELPFDLALSGRLFDPARQNVLFTLLFGLLALWGAQALKEKFMKKRPDAPEAYVGAAALLFAGTAAAAAAFFLRTDYGAFGVLAILAMYCDPRGSALAGCLCLLGCGWIELFALADLPLLRRYNGKRGKGAKYFFYLFYPLHLLALALCREIFIM